MSEGYSSAARELLICRYELCFYSLLRTTLLTVYVHMFDKLHAAHPIATQQSCGARFK
jgi:hypothetical protein